MAMSPLTPPRAPVNEDTVECLGREISKHYPVAPVEPPRRSPTRSGRVARRHFTTVPTQCADTLSREARPAPLRGRSEWDRTITSPVLCYRSAAHGGIMPVIERCGASRGRHLRAQVCVRLLNATHFHHSKGVARGVLRVDDARGLRTALSTTSSTVSGAL